MADLEEKQIEVEGLLIKASSQELKDLAKVLKLEEAKLADKSKLTVLKLIRKHIGENPTAETLEEVSTFFGKDPPALEGMEEEKQQRMKALKKAGDNSFTSPISRSISHLEFFGVTGFCISHLQMHKRYIRRIRTRDLMISRRTLSPLDYRTVAAEALENLWYLCTAAGPDPDPNPIKT